MDLEQMSAEKAKMAVLCLENVHPMRERSTGLQRVTSELGPSQPLLGDATQDLGRGLLYVTTYLWWVTLPGEM